MTMENTTIALETTNTENNIANYVVLAFSLSMVAMTAVLMHFLH